MTNYFSILTRAALVAAAVVTSSAHAADDYWAPEKMAARQCSSVHLRYLPTIQNHTAVYNEMVIEKSAPGTYFAANNFDSGYIGVQEIVRDEKPLRVAIFSVWDAKTSGDDVHAAPEKDRAKLVQKGEAVTSRRFGGEGTGGNSMRLFPWNEGEIIRTLVIEKMDGEHFRQIAGYIFNPTSQKWELLSCWRIQAIRRGLGGGAGFVEDFRRNVESKLMERRATFGPCFRWADGKWNQATSFFFSKDGNPNMEINCRLNPKRGFYSIAAGGATTPSKDFPVFSEKKLVPLPKSPEPGARVQTLIDAPLLEVKQYPLDVNPF